MDAEGVFINLDRRAEGARRGYLRSAARARLATVVCISAGVLCGVGAVLIPLIAPVTGWAPHSAASLLCAGVALLLPGLVRMLGLAEIVTRHRQCAAELGRLVDRGRIQWSVMPSDERSRWLEEYSQEMHAIESREVAGWVASLRRQARNIASQLREM